MNVTRISRKIFSIIQIVLEIINLGGFVLGLVWFPYFFFEVFVWTIPLAIINVIIAGYFRNGTLITSSISLVLTAVAIIPILGTLASIVGILTTLTSAIIAAEWGGFVSSAEHLKKHRRKAYEKVFRSYGFVGRGETRSKKDKGVKQMETDNVVDAEVVNSKDSQNNK